MRINSTRKGGKNTNRFGDEIVAVNDKLFECECNTKTQHKNMVIIFNLKFLLKINGGYEIDRSILKSDGIRYTLPSLRTLNQEHSRFFWYSRRR